MVANHRTKKSLAHVFPTRPHVFLTRPELKWTPMPETATPALESTGMPPTQPAPDANSAADAGYQNRPSVVVPHLRVPTFGVVRRGYEPAEVDAQIRALIDQHERMGEEVILANNRLAAVEAELKTAKAELAEHSEPTYAGLGSRAAAMLKFAQEEAEDVRAAANRDAAAIRAQADRDVATQRSEAALEIETLREEQTNELNAARERVQGEIDRLVVQARGEAQEHVATAEREATQLRMAADKEVADLKLTTQRDIERQQAESELKLQEARSTLAAEKDRMAREATEHHNALTEQSAKMVSDAEARAAAAEVRAQEMLDQANEQRASARQYADDTLNKAGTEADRVKRAARDQATAMTAGAQAEADRRLATVRSEVERLHKRRVAVTSQMAQLQELMTTFSQNASDLDYDDEFDMSPQASTGDKAE